MTTRPPSRRYLGSWTLPSGNSADVYLDLPSGRLACEWDVPPSPTWPRSDVEHYQRVTFPETVRVVATATGKQTLGAVA